MLKRQKQVTVRFTEEEYHQLKNKCDAAGMKMVRGKSSSSKMPCDSLRVRIPPGALHEYIWNASWSLYTSTAMPDHSDERVSTGLCVRQS